ncbi:MAG: bifunctional DNA-formamidopyrimidine glycosylase/DNA-(apurinic or apyrimidinic site) lyase [Actinobacteria bacterium]|nr:bifunctional DNA-formamidopyrimidine glycosylase/DNA-(apurinic or apyrimidinic site) lyase [Actinomycetota bacterium]
MPELPEVETIRAQLARELPGSKVVAAGSHPSVKFAEAADSVGSRIDEITRRGKYLKISLEGHRELIIHLGMTGQLAFTPDRPTTLDQDGTQPWRRAWWALDDGRTLAFTDQRRFGRIAVVTAGHYERLPTLATLRPEPLDPSFGAPDLHRALAQQRRHVKTALLSQRVVAGIGNIYADEALWRARIDPAARRIGPTRAARLHEAIVTVLTEAITNGGTRLRDYRTIEGDTGRHQWQLDCYGRAGQDCRRCGTPLTHRVLDGRGTTWCRRCQQR